MIINVLIQLKLREARMLCSIQASDGTETETIGSSPRASSRTPIEQLVCRELKIYLSTVIAVFWI